MSDLATFRALFQQAVSTLTDAGIPDAAREVTRLLAHVCDTSQAAILAGDVSLSKSRISRFQNLVRRRAHREPLQYLLQTCEFWGRPFHVTPDVLIPRPETEHVIEVALHRMPPDGCVLDCCTGSGCIAISLGLERPASRIVATDISAPALRIAMKNRERLGARNVTFARMNMLTAVRDHAIDLITANPPYVSPLDADSLQPELRHEPDIALFSEDNGLALIRVLLSEAPRVLKKGGHLVMEFGYNQGHTIRLLTAGAASRRPVSLDIVKDLSGVERVGIFRFS